MKTNLVKIIGYTPIKNINAYGRNGKIQAYKPSSDTPLPTLKPVKRNFIQSIIRDIKIFVRANLSDWK